MKENKLKKKFKNKEKKKIVLTQNENNSCFRVKKSQYQQPMTLLSYLTLVSIDHMDLPKSTKEKVKKKSSPYTLQKLTACDQNTPQIKHLHKIINLML
jgi:hypothetical protein